MASWNDHDEPADFPAWLLTALAVSVFLWAPVLAGLIVYAATRALS